MRFPWNLVALRDGSTSIMEAARRNGARRSTSIDNLATVEMGGVELWGQDELVFF